MTDDQKKSVDLYSAVSCILFAIVGILTLNTLIGDKVKEILGLKEADVDEAVGSHVTEFRSLAGVPIYIPYVSRVEVVDQIICAPLAKVTESFLPESIMTDDGNTKNESVATLENFPTIKTEAGLEVIKLILYFYIIFF